MTFEQFQATKKRQTREVFARTIGVDQGQIGAAHVLTYFDGSAFIEDDEGKGFYLLLGRDDWLEPDLETLERLLYDWCESEGHFEPMPESDKPKPRVPAEPMEPSDDRPRPEHLGDGVYASFDGYQIWLAVNHHANKVVALEPRVMDQLTAYAKRVWAKP